MKKLLFISLIVLVLLSASVMAAVPTVWDGITGLGKFVKELIKGDATYDGTYLLSFILYFILFIALFIEGLKYLPFFGGRGEVNAPGKWFAFAAAMLSTLAIFIGEQMTGLSTRDTVAYVTQPFGIWAGVALGGIIAFISYKAIRDAGFFGDSVMKAMAFSLAFGLTVAGWLLSPALLGWGIGIMLLVLLIGLLVGSWNFFKGKDIEAAKRGKRRTRFRGREVPSDEELAKQGSKRNWRGKTVPSDKALAKQGLKRNWRGKVVPIGKGKTTPAKPATPSASPKASPAVKPSPAAKPKVEKIEKTLGRALRRVFRFNKKVKKDLEKAYEESLQKKKISLSYIARKLRDAKKYEKKEMDFNALATKVEGELSKIAGSQKSLARKLLALSGMILVDLKKIGTLIAKAEVLVQKNNPSAIAATLKPAIDSAEKIEEEIWELEAVVKGIRKEL